MTSDHDESLPGDPPLLWVTRAALDDLGLGPLAGPTFDLDANLRRHPILRRFARQRALDPRGTEPTQNVAGEVYNLHAKNPTRGVTWYDTEANVVFLLAVSLIHDYTEFERRSAAGTLMPTEADYADVAGYRDPFDGGDLDFLAVAGPQAEALVESALATPGRLVTGVLGGELPTCVQVEVILLDDATMEGDVFAAMRLETRSGLVELPATIVSDLAFELFPDAAVEDVDLYHDRFPSPRGKLPGDVVVRWRRP